jgi:hypothetical protein
MNTNHTSLPDRLERLTGAQLARQRDLRAPASLEARVMAAIAAQTAPWYARSFRHWPWWARALFVLAAALVAYWLSGKSVVVFNAAQSQLATHSGTALADVSSWLDVLGTLRRSFDAIVQLVPTGWALLVTATIFTCYATLAAGGMFAYRTIFKVQRT